MIELSCFKVCRFLAAVTAVAFVCCGTAEAQRRGGPRTPAPKRAPAYRGPTFKAPHRRPVPLAQPSIKIGPVRIALPVAQPRRPIPVAPKFYVAPPRGYVSVQIGGLSYYRVGNVHYRPMVHQGNTVYVVANPTLLANAPVQPELYDQVIVNNQVYYREKLPLLPQDAVAQQYADTPVIPNTTDQAYLVPPANQDTVIPNPYADPTVAPDVVTSNYEQSVLQQNPIIPDSSFKIGSKVRVLPTSARQLVYDTTTYYVAENTYYLPVGEEENPEFIIVANPIR